MRKSRWRTGLWLSDDRGRDLKLVHLRTAQKCGAYPSWPTILGIVSFTIALLGFAPFATTGLSQQFSTASRVWMTVCAVVAVPGIVCCLLFIHTWGKSRYEPQEAAALRWASRILWKQHCPGCACSLAGLTPELDDCIRCPQCDAAWKAERVGKPTRSRLLWMLRHLSITPRSWRD